jgi:hypothetical protein
MDDREPSLDQYARYSKGRGDGAATAGYSPSKVDQTALHRLGQRLGASANLSEAGRPPWAATLLADGGAPEPRGLSPNPEAPGHAYWGDGRSAPGGTVTRAASMVPEIRGTGTEGPTPFPPGPASPDLLTALQSLQAWEYIASGLRYGAMFYTGLLVTSSGLGVRILIKDATR